MKDQLVTGNETAVGSREPALEPALFDSGSHLKVFLAYCPQSHPPTAPHPALPYLKAYLNQELPNVTVVQKDLDAIFLAHVFSKNELAKVFPPEQAEKVRAAYEAQKDIQTYQDIPRFIDAHKTLEAALDHISEKHQKEKHLTQRYESLRLRGNTFTYISEHTPNSRQGILEAIKPEERVKNLFHAYYKEKVVPYIIAEGYGVIGLSVYLTDQLIPTFLLAAMIKEADPNIKVIIGGNYISRFEDVLSKDDEQNRRLFDVIDAIIIKNGEAPLKETIDMISKKPGDAAVDLSGINQVISKKESSITTVNKYPERTTTNINPTDLPRPDFDGIFTDLEEKESVFWTPEPVISMYTQRGCPYVAKSCEFCAIPSGNNVPNSALQRSAEKVAEDINFYQKKYRTKYFSFGNETLGKRFMVDLTAALQRRGLEAVIDGYTRSDKFIDGEAIDTTTIKNISPYFRFLQIGFESSDTETLESMAKNRKPVNDGEIAKALFEAGIIPHAFLMVGFPPEKEKYEGEEPHDYLNFYMKSAIRTLQWLLKNKDNIGTYKATRLVLPRDSKMVKRENGAIVLDPRYNHEIELKPSRDLEYNIPYKKKNGTTELDEAIVGLFDFIQPKMPYWEFTHSFIYHQRQFAWEAGLEWSNGEKILQKIWKAAVGKHYHGALRERGKKGGINKTKRDAMDSIIRETQEKNRVAGAFPHGIKSINNLIKIFSTMDE